MHGSRDLDAVANRSYDAPDLAIDCGAIGRCVAGSGVCMSLESLPSAPLDSRRRGSRRATMQDVARRAAVSTTTVSHVLNGTRRVRDEVSSG